MKKLSIGLFLCLLSGNSLWSQSSYSEHVISEGIRQGDVLFSVFAGGMRPAHKTGIKASGIDSELPWGGTGGQYGVGGVRFFHDYIGFGLELNGANTTYASKMRSGVQFKTAMDVWSTFLTSRININPYHPVRLYVPMGAGLSLARSRWKNVSVDTSDENTDVSLGYFIGACIETNWNSQDQSVGLEVRYSNFGFNKAQYIDKVQLSGQGRYGYLSVVLKLSYRF